MPAILSKKHFLCLNLICSLCRRCSDCHPFVTQGISLTTESLWLLSTLDINWKSFLKPRSFRILVVAMLMNWTFDLWLVFIKYRHMLIMNFTHQVHLKNLKYCWCYCLYDFTKQIIICNASYSTVYYHTTHTHTHTHIHTDIHTHSCSNTYIHTRAWAHVWALTLTLINRCIHLYIMPLKPNAHTSNITCSINHDWW